MADILPADACQPCHQSVPKLKLLPRDVKTLFQQQPPQTSPFPPNFPAFAPPMPRQ
jgi:hypothetical protein